MSKVELGRPDDEVNAFLEEHAENIAQTAWDNWWLFTDDEMRRLVAKAFEIQREVAAGICDRLKGDMDSKLAVGGRPKKYSDECMWKQHAYFKAAVMIREGK